MTSPEDTVAQLRQDVQLLAWLHAELDYVVKVAIARAVAAQVGPRIQEMLQSELLQRMASNSVRDTVS